MTEPLKPCPFCGATFAEGNILFTGEHHYSGKHHYYIMCRICRINTQLYESSEEAFTAWNSRAPSKDRSFLIEMSMPDMSTDGLDILINNRFWNGKYIVEEIRKHLEENP